MIKICKRCNTSYEYEQEEELKKYFYKKPHGYWPNVCKKCVLIEHAKKYKTGQYKYKRPYMPSVGFIK
jgi:hypothetical protein